MIQISRPFESWLNVFSYICWSQTPKSIKTRYDYRLRQSKVLLGLETKLRMKLNVFFSGFFCVCLLVKPRLQLKCLTKHRGVSAEGTLKKYLANNDDLFDAIHTIFRLVTERETTYERTNRTQKWRKKSSSTWILRIMQHEEICKSLVVKPIRSNHQMNSRYQVDLIDLEP